jgi:O-antigen ligase
MRSLDYYNLIKEKAEKKLKWVSFFMAYPNWVILQNISFFFLLSFYQSTSKYYIKAFKIASPISLAAYLLILGALISAVNCGFIFDFEYFVNSIKVLPNYTYWGLIVITVGNLAVPIMKLAAFYKQFFYGIILATLSYYPLSPLLKMIPIFNDSSPNHYAFLLILFGPMATSYVQKKWKNGVYTFLFIIGITLAGFLSGSRSGSLLTLAGCSLVVAINSWVRILIVAFLSLFVSIAAPQILDSPEVKQAIFELNERTYSLIYETENTLNTDQSYLTRLAMIEKGLNIFEDHPISGVGLGNFGKVTYNIDFEFDGAELLEQKYETLETGISAHNSYISFLAEGGLLVFIPMLIIMFYPILYFILNFNFIKEEEKALFVSIIFMCIHAWFISAMLNAFGWFVIGIANSYIIYHKNKILHQV